MVTIRTVPCLEFSIPLDNALRDWQMANSRQVITSLLTEHFRYTPLTLVDDIINTVNELVYRAVTAVEEGLTNAPAESLGFADRAIAENRTPEKDEDGYPFYPESRPEIEHGVHQLETLLDSTVDKNFDKLEIFVLRSILSVPEDLAPWMRLAHYENLETDASSSTINPQSIDLLRRKVQESRKLNAALVAEQSRNTALIRQLKGLLQSAPNSADSHPAPLSFIASKYAVKPLETNQSDSDHQNILTTYTQSTISQTPTLRRLIESLRPKLGSLEGVKTTATGEERREYIEGQTRRRLERDGINIQTGEGLLAMRNLGPRIWSDEINGIEAVAGMLESNKLARASDNDVMEE